MDESVASFLAALASDAPSPGGGAAAALAAASGAALVEMVCRFSAGREAYAEWQEQIIATLATAGRLRQELLAVVDADAAAFAAVADAYALPRATREERQRRRAVVADALVGAAEPPLGVAAAVATLADLAVALVGHSNAQLVSDLGAAGALGAAALRIAGYNVTANAQALKNDPRGAALQAQFVATRDKAEDALAALRVAVEAALVPAPPQ